MQQPQQMIPMMPSFPPNNITTEQIQKYLDENKKLILAILDNQNLGKLAECAQYQAQLQKNLMYLAAICGCTTTNKRPQQQLHLQHQQAMQAQMRIRPGGPNNGMHPMQVEANLGGGSSGGPSSASGPNDGRCWNKQEGAEAGVDGQGSTGGGHGDGADKAK
ncbi:GRF1-interacting factor 3-like [Hibiscus syriacus]|uniref:GRF1-interacting factor 3-like n=1 Tax=Hibiscus syriacus TaxID=106335 RepID=UPI0019231DEB|nr:GRF1-interacting factor 3-like [Hibiscus syriacus]XP_039008357.1 GRF1-interacting factor 3-like [Hibiscus syriacus]XP_039008358.1 GRF1-interacting factor 3-like [Hibiscus syriacus]